MRRVAQRCSCPPADEVDDCAGGPDESTGGVDPSGVRDELIAPLPPGRQYSYPPCEEMTETGRQRCPLFRECMQSVLQGRPLLQDCERPLRPRRTRRKPELRRAILAHLREHPGASYAELIRALPGYTGKEISAQLVALRSQGRVVAIRREGRKLRYALS